MSKRTKLFSSSVEHDKELLKRISDWAAIQVGLSPDDAAVLIKKQNRMSGGLIGGGAHQNEEMIIRGEKHYYYVGGWNKEKLDVYGSIRIMLDTYSNGTMIMEDGTELTNTEWWAYYAENIVRTLVHEWCHILDYKDNITEEGPFVGNSKKRVEHGKRFCEIFAINKTKGIMNNNSGKVKEFIEELVKDVPNCIQLRKIKQEKKSKGAIKRWENKEKRRQAMIEKIRIATETRYGKSRIA